MHRLVLLAFVGKCPPGKQALHRDGDPSNNRLTNLYWGTPLENAADCVRHGRQTRGERNGNAKLSEADIYAARDMRRDGLSIRRIACALGVSRWNVSLILDGRSWRHVA